MSAPALLFIDPKGRRWYPYTITFDSPDGTFDVDLYAISEDHARLQLDALKETGRVTGRIIEVFPEDDPAN
ncbi:hypothetical protein [Castellaniella sp.]|uniref:hypothetical protein n=1 Tax=Castellaniella sp. TaxID=1955812 RepID=UPI002AFEEDED|nr:hypothetical protein [Castellaniella sp.]